MILIIMYNTKEYSNQLMFFYYIYINYGTNLQKISIKSISELFKSYRVGCNLHKIHFTIKLLLSFLNFFVESEQLIEKENVDENRFKKRLPRSRSI